MTAEIKYKYLVRLLIEKHLFPTTSDMLFQFTTRKHMSYIVQLLSAQTVHAGDDDDDEEEEEEEDYPYDNLCLLNFMLL